MRKFIATLLSLILLCNCECMTVNASPAQRTANLSSKGVIQYINPIGDTVIFDSNDLYYIADEIDYLEEFIKEGISDSLCAIGTSAQRTGTFSQLFSAIESSQNIQSTDIAAVPRNLSKGTAAWVQGTYVVGTGADVDAAYQKGYADGKANAVNGEIQYVYHVHKGNPKLGTGCYTRGVHKHNSSCARHQHHGVNHAPLYQRGTGCYGIASTDCGLHWLSGCPLSAWHHGLEVLQPGYIPHYWGYCDNCGATHSDQYNGASCCPNTTVDWYCPLACGKTEGQYDCGNPINYYELGCGKTESTIESAIIVFP